MKKLIIAGFFISTLSACWDTPRVDTESVRQEMQTRKIAYVTKGDMAVEAEAIGLQLLEASINGQLDEDSIKKLEGISISVINENTLNKASALESQLFEAYKHSFESGNTSPGNNVQYDKNEGVYYISTPVLVDDSVLNMWTVGVSDKAVIINRSAK